MTNTYKALQVASFFLAITDPDDNDMSNLKIQKLCYYAQGLATAVRGQALFSDRIEAWDHGPVVPTLYHYFKDFKSAPIPALAGFDTSQIDEKDREVLKDIYEYYAQFSAWRLRNMTHEEKPWIDAYRRQNKEISLDELLSFFGPQIEEDYKSSHV